MKSMHGWTSRWLWVAGTLIAAATGACGPGGVGDPCIPEDIPPNGFVASESFVESSSVQCRTRVCVVHELEGNPTNVCSESNADPECVSETEIDNKVFCSCRCDVPDDVQGSFETCSCPSGWECQELLSMGGDGIRGSYCVKPVDSLVDG